MKQGTKKESRVSAVCESKVCMYLDRGSGPWSWMTTDLAAVLIGPLLVVELQLFGSTSMVVPYRLCLLGRGLT